MEFYWLLAHLIGDFILQNDWMAQNKKTSSFACFAHATSYMIFFMPFLWLGLSPVGFILIWIQHFMQDRTNFVLWFMDQTGSSDFKNAPMSPWSIIITDNILHLVWIAIIMNL